MSLICYKGEGTGLPLKRQVQTRAAFLKELTLHLLPEPANRGIKNTTDFLFKHLVFNIILNYQIILNYSITIEKISTLSNYLAFILQLVDLKTELNLEFLERSILLAVIWWVHDARGMSGNHIGSCGG